MKKSGKRQAVALAVAAALLAASGAAAADQVNYDRITESIDSPTTDAVVTYTDQTADTFVTQPPVMPEDRDAPEFISLKMNKPLYCKGLFINYFSSPVVQLFGRAMSLSRSFLHSDCAVS